VATVDDDRYARAPSPIIPPETYECEYYCYDGEDNGRYNADYCRFAPAGLEEMLDQRDPNYKGYQ
jgi:hypothetical protein